MYFVYLLRCVDSSLYCGYTNDLAHRIKAHAGIVPGGAKYTRSHKPERVEAVWKCDKKGAALSLEHAIKGLCHAEKEELIRDRGLFTALLGEKLDVSLFAQCREFEGEIS